MEQKNDKNLQLRSFQSSEGLFFLCVSPLLSIPETLT